MLGGCKEKDGKILIRKESFYPSKVLGKYWRIIIDGTGLFYFHEKHYENCLVSTITQEEGGKEVKLKRYYHKVLEAKLVLVPGIIVILDTEFIENENEDVSKNDCEINTAKRLLEWLGKEYPRLPICLQGDTLYTAESFLEICRSHKWRYILTQKALAESYEWIVRGGGTEGVEGTGERSA